MLWAVMRRWVTRSGSVEHAWEIREAAMTFLPIVFRELRVSSRRPGTYWIRSGAAMVVVVAGTWLFLMMNQAPPRIVATTLFGVLTGAAVLYGLLSGVRSTADCLSCEKREGTLGLLFLTDLKGYDVVLGKLVATSVGVSYAVLAIVPVLAVPLLLGGITPGEFGRMALVALNTLFFSLAAGICISSLSRSSRNAAALTLMVMLTFSALLPLMGVLFAKVAKASAVPPGFLVPSPGCAYYLAFDSAYRAAGRLFWYSLAAIHLLAWGALVVASLVAPRSWQERPRAAAAPGWRERISSWSYGAGIVRAEHRQRLLSINPFFWLAARARFRGLWVWVALGLIAGGWLWGYAKFRRDWLNEGVYVGTALAVNCLLRFLFANEAARQLVEERRAGSLELLLSTPLRVPEILRGQFLALSRLFMGPLITALIIESIFMLAVVSDNLSVERKFWFCLWTGGMLMLIADMASLYWVCQWQALTARNPARAAGNSLALIGVVPWAIYAIVLVAMAVLSIGHYNQPGPDWRFFLGLWFVLGMAADIWFGALARHNLLTHFREVAQQRFVPTAGFFARLIAGNRR